MTYVLIILYFIHGSPPKLDGTVVAIYNDANSCCVALEKLSDGIKRNTVQFCAATDRDARGSGVIVKCKD